MTEEQIEALNALRSAIDNLLNPNNINTLDATVMQVGLTFKQFYSLVTVSTKNIEDNKGNSFLLEIKGKSFSCKCRCNVFHKKYDRGIEEFICNACGKSYTVE